MTAGIDEAPGHSSITVIERVDIEDARGIPVGWRWRCCTKGCDANESGLDSYSEAVDSPRRLAHVCVPPEAPGYQHGDLVTVAGVGLIVDVHHGEQVTVYPEGGGVGFTVHQDEVHERLLLDEGGDLIEYATAVFNQARTHRYQLTRVWDAELPPAVFLLLNPSVADAFKVDPTITRCIRFARRENTGGLVVVNLFALRSTDPAVLVHHGNPIGHSNNRLIVEAVQDAAVVIAGWGVPGQLAGRDREVCSLLAERHIGLKCLGRNKDGSPKHPLYVRGDQPLEPYRLETPA